MRAKAPLHLTGITSVDNLKEATIYFYLVIYNYIYILIVESVIDYVFNFCLFVTSLLLILNQLGLTEQIFLMVLHSGSQPVN